MITCPNCSTSNPDEAQTCISCGAPLVGTADMPAGETTSQAENEIPEPSPYAEPDKMQTPPAEESPNDLTAVPSAPPYRLPEPPASGIKKDRSLAIILEVVPGLVGFLGIGWIYSGYTNIGVAWLLGFLVWNIVALASVFTWHKILVASRRRFHRA